MTANGAVPEPVRRVCDEHYESVPETGRIFWFPHSPGDEGEEPIQLVEIETGASGVEGDMVLPFTFTAQDEFPSISVAVLTQNEWAKVEAHEEGWEMPVGWDWDAKIEVLREASSTQSQNGVPG